MKLYCKNCGREIEVNEEKTVVCDFCGMEQTVPESDDYKDEKQLLEELPQKRAEQQARLTRCKRKNKTILITILSVSVALIVALVITFFCVSDYNARDGLILQEEGGYYVVTGIDGNAKSSYKIPSTYKGKPVKEIRSSAFSGCSNIKSIEIPDSITSIGASAFSGCSSLKSITIPFVGETKDGTSNTHFGYIFGAGGNNDNSTYVPTSLKTVKITGGTSIRAAAFYYCSSIESIEMPSSVTSIETGAFAFCISLESIEIPSSVTSIGSYAFLGCVSLVSIEIPSSVTSIGESAFYDCDKLTIYCESESEPSGWDRYWNDSNCPVVWNCKSNNVADDGYEYGITVNGINYAIADNTVKVVGTNATGDITIPSTIAYNSNTYYVTSIGEWAFSYCDSLESIEIPNSVISIGSYAFDVCSSLESIEIPNSVTIIGYRAFSACNKLTIYCEAESKPSEWYDWNNSNRPVVWSCKSNNVADDGYVYGITVNGINYAIKDNTAKVVGTNAIGHITIPSSITYNSKTYYVKSIGSYAFEYCSSLKSIEIPNSITSIGKYAFYGCSNLTKANYTGTIDQWVQIDFDYYNSNPLYYADKLYINDVLIGNAVITTATKINGYAFAGYGRLKSVTIGDSVTSIGREAFYDCSSIESITIPFVGATKDGTINTYFGYIFNTVPTSLKTVKITGGPSIGSYAFAYCSSIESIEISSSVTSIGSYAFYDCNNLSIYCEAESKPSGWDSNWNGSNCPVVWGYTSKK